MSDQPSKATPFPIQRRLKGRGDVCPHGIPVDVDCLQCHQIKRDDKGEDAPA
jgi:hypothetical protein